jgi:hypothetical protein
MESAGRGRVVISRCEVGLLLINGPAPHAADRGPAAEPVLPDEFAVLVDIQGITNTGFLWDHDDVAAIRQSCEDR